MPGFDGGHLAFHQASDLDFAVPAGGRFYVELTPGETTFVSWKKLLKEHKSLLACSSSGAPAGAHPALEARIAPQVSREVDFFHPVNRLSSVIERIERLYQGDNSDNELSECVEDAKYDARDPFIDDTELDDYFSVDNAKLKHEGFFVNRGKLEQESEQLPSAVAGTNLVKRKLLKKCSSELQVATKESAIGKKVKRVEACGPSDKFHEAKKAEGKEVGDDTVLMGIDIARKEKTSKDHVLHKHGEVIDSSKVDAKMLLKHRELLEVGFRGTEATQSMTMVENFKNDKTSLVPAKKVALTGQNITPLLEKAISELQKEVTEVCSPSLFSLDLEQSKRSYLPRSIKQKLANVARLAIKKGGSIDMLVKRLNEILGHLVQKATLKKIFEAMLELGSCAMQEKETRLRKMKAEVAEMIMLGVQAQNVLSSQGAQPQISCLERLRRKFQWDQALEDKICNLCEQYIEEVDEEKGLHLRKLYAELIELWPEGWMDSMSIKLAVHRAKERTKLHDKASGKKRQLKCSDDDNATILQIIAKKSPSLGQRPRALSNLRKEF